MLEPSGGPQCALVLADVPADPEAQTCAGGRRPARTLLPAAAPKPGHVGAVSMPSPRVSPSATVTPGP